jgi:protease PrsW
MVLSVLLILLLSFVPMVAYAMALWWLDRYEKEPLGLLVVAFLWGAVPSIILALIMQIVLDVPLMAIHGSNQLTYELVGASVVAPLTEEGVKALALLLLLLLFHREIDSPVDGLIYGGVVGFGFAAVENVLYLFGAFAEEGLVGVLGLALLRAGVFGLNHAMYTGFAGLGMALSLEVKPKLLKLALILGGFGLAVGTHAAHNALATFAGLGGIGPLLAAVLLDWLGVLVLLGVALGTFFLERRRIVAYAEALVRNRVIPPSEVDLLKSTFQRRKVRLAALLDGDLRRWRVLQQYQHKVTEAAFAWHRMHGGHTSAQPRLERLEREFLQLRREVATPS